MAAYNKFNAFVEGQWNDKIDWNSDVFKLLATNVSPVATNSVKADLTEITPGNGYSAGGPTVSVSTNRVAGTLTVSGGQVVITAAGGPISTFQYLSLYDDTVATKPLVAWFDYGSPLTMADTNTLTVRFNGANPGTIHTVS